MEIEEGYRRGTVLGLTIAEIFVLLVFLMLLALLGVNRFWNEKLEPWMDIIARTTPAEVENALNTPDELRRKIEELTRQIAELTKEKERLQERVRTLVAREGRLGKANRVLTKTNEELRARLDELAKMNEELREENAALRDKIRVSGKGINPPCWYRIVRETNPATEATSRERTYYLFDIVIREDHMEVQPVPIPPGRADDDGGRPYSEEAVELGLGTIPYGEPLSNARMLELMRPIFEMGKESRVRKYSCIFHVRVWDETPATSKGRWKQAHYGVLQQRFGTYQVPDFGWSERDEHPANVPHDRRVPPR